MNNFNSSINYVSEKILNIFIFEDGASINELLLEETMQSFTESILKTQISKFLSIIDTNDLEICTPRHIPQFSDLNSAIYVEVDYLKNHGKSTIADIGAALPKQITNTIGAQKKYGENHTKLLEVFGIVSLEDGVAQLTEVGKCFSKMCASDRVEFIKRCIFRIPIIRNILIKSKYKKVSVMAELELFLSETTAKRRQGNVCKLI